MTGFVDGWTPRYEFRAVCLLSLGFGLVGLDRWIITPLFPFIMKDLHLDYSQIGALAGILAVAWGGAAILMGHISDRIGRRRVLIPAILLFSLLAGATGFAAGFAMLMALRGMMGLTEGAFTPASVAATAEASRPLRRGLNQGIQLSLFALIGLGFGPIIATQLLAVVPSWRYVFLAVCIPGFIVALGLYLVIREPSRGAGAEDVPAPVRGVGHDGWFVVLRSRNTVLALLGILCAMSCIFVISAMMPNYLLDFLKLSPRQMGLVMSAIGFGGFLGEFAVPGLSDHVGRRPMAVATFLVALGLLRWFATVGAHPAMLFGLLFALGFCCMGLLALFTGPVPTEAVPAGLMATAIGLVSGAGEVFGGGVAPTLSGWIAQSFGIQHVLDLATVGLACGVPIAFLLRETAPRRMASRRARAEAYRP